MWCSKSGMQFNDVQYNTKVECNTLLHITAAVTHRGAVINDGKVALDSLNDDDDCDQVKLKCDKLVS